MPTGAGTQLLQRHLPELVNRANPPGSAPAARSEALEVALQFPKALEGFRMCFSVGNFHLSKGLQLNLAIILSARLNGLTAFKVLLSLLPRNEPTQQHFTRVLGIRGSLKSDSVIGKWRL